MAVAYLAHFHCVKTSELTSEKCILCHILRFIQLEGSLNSNMPSHAVVHGNLVRRLERLLSEPSCNIEELEFGIIRIPGNPLLAYGVSHY